MEVGKYCIVILIIHLFIVVDLTLNTISAVARVHNEYELLIYVIQDVLQVFAIFMMFLLIFNTYVFQAGLVHLLMKKYRAPLVISIVYLCLSIPLHSCLLKKRWDNPYTYVWDAALFTLFIFQRTVAVLHYYLLKRMMLWVSNPRLYVDSNWLRDEMVRSK